MTSMPLRMGACRSWLPAVAAVAAMTAGVAVAQVHQARSAEHTVRASTIASSRIDAATAAQHGIETAPDRAVLNVVVLRRNPAPGAAENTVAAQVSARTRNLAGTTHEVELKEVRENGRVSYLGSYPFLPAEVLDLRVVATPAGASQALTLEWRERMPR